MPAPRRGGPRTARPPGSLGIGRVRTRPVDQIEERTWWRRPARDHRRRRPSRSGGGASYRPRAVHRSPSPRCAPMRRCGRAQSRLGWAARQAASACCSTGRWRDGLELALPPSCRLEVASIAVTGRAAAPSGDRDPAAAGAFHSRHSAGAGRRSSRGVPACAGGGTAGHPVVVARIAADPQAGSIAF
jgi:hypothetical protein